MTIAGFAGFINVLEQEFVAVAPVFGLNQTTGTAVLLGFATLEAFLAAIAAKNAPAPPVVVVPAPVPVVPVPTPVAPAPPSAA